MGASQKHSTEWAAVELQRTANNLITLAKEKYFEGDIETAHDILVLLGDRKDQDLYQTICQQLQETEREG